MLGDTDEMYMAEMDNGVTIVGKIEGWGDECTVILIRPIKGVPRVDNNGRQGLQWVPWLGERVRVNRCQLVGELISTVPENIRNVYIQITTGISVASAGDLPNKGKLVS